MLLNTVVLYIQTVERLKANMQTWLSSRTLVLLNFTCSICHQCISLSLFALFTMRLSVISVTVRKVDGLMVSDLMPDNGTNTSSTMSFIQTDLSFPAVSQISDFLTAE